MTSLPSLGIAVAGVNVNDKTPVRPHILLLNKRKGPIISPLTMSGNDPAVERLRMRLEESRTAAFMLTTAACANGFVKLVNVIDMAAPAALVLLVKVSVSTLPVKEAESVAEAAVAVGLPPKAGEPAIVMTSLPLLGMAAVGFTLIVKFIPLTESRWSVLVN